MFECDLHITKAGWALKEKGPVVSNKEFRRLQETVGMARTLASHVMDRVSNRGRTTTPAPGYASKRPIYVSRAYQEEAMVVAPDPNRPARFENSADFHKRARVKKGTYFVTGGMWSGLVVTNWGGDLNKALIKFRRSSTAIKAPSRLQRKAKPRKKWRISNNLKAFVVKRVHGVHVLDQFDDEVQAMADAVSHKGLVMLKEVFGGEQVNFTIDGNKRLFERIIREGET
tara:strand:+ start:725 stop:1408 length:684 start_codon:yes stop_codon:yes gene_type:complete